MLYKLKQIYGKTTKRDRHHYLKHLKSYRDSRWAEGQEKVRDSKKAIERGQDQYNSSKEEGRERGRGSEVHTTHKRAW